MSTNIDLKDKKIIYELDIDSSQSASQIAKKIGLSKEVVNYRINNLLKSGIINYFYLFLNTLALGYFHYKIYIKLQDISLKKEEELMEYFIKNKNCIWVANCRGNWDLAVSVLAKTPSEFDKIYQRIIQDYGRNILEKNILMIESAPTFNRNYLRDASKRVELKYKQIEKIIDLDEIDKKILAVMSINSRISIVELMNKINLTRDVISYRIKRMKEEGLIQGFRTSFNLNRIGYSYYKILLTFKNLDEKREKDLINFCRFSKNITQYIRLIGKSVILEN